MTKSHGHFQIGLALFLLLCAVSLDLLVLGSRAETATSQGKNSASTPAQAYSVRAGEGLSQNIRDAIEAIRPSLVTISGASRTRSSPLLIPLLPEFSDGDYGSSNNSVFPPSVLQSSTDRGISGTGVIVSEDGLIWTGTDVVGDQESVSVTRQNNESYEGKVVLRDSASGLAIVKIDAENLRAAHIRSKSKPSLADWAVAVALDQSHEPILASGLISSLNWRKSDSEEELSLIRCGFPVSTDFAGCAFVNLNGELIGINVSNPKDFAHASSSCIALNTQFAIERQQKLNEGTMTNWRERDDSTSTVDDSVTVQDLSQQRKEGTLSKLDNVFELFSVPRLEQASAHITSSVRNWLAPGQDAIDPLPHPVSDPSESR